MSIHDDFREVYTFAEAAKMYKLKDTSTLRKAVIANKFRDDEIEKKGKTWFVKKSALDRIWGHRLLSVSERAKDATKRSNELTRFSKASKIDRNSYKER